MSWNQVKEIRVALEKGYLDFWRTENFLSLEWWFMLGGNLFFLVIGYFLIDRKRIFEMFTVMGMVLALTTVLDLVTLHFNLTAYRLSLTPVTPSLITSTYIVLPITYTIIYQKFPTWKKYLLVIFSLAFVYAYIVESFLRWINIYEYLDWKAYYSFFIFIAIGIVTKIIMNILHKVKDNSR